MTAARLRHGAGARLLVEHRCRKPFAPIAGAFDVGAGHGVKGGALIPAIAVGVLSAPFTGVFCAPAAMLTFGVFFLPARLIGGFIARHLSRFVYLDSPRRLQAQGLILGAAASALLFGLPVSGLIGRAPLWPLVQVGALAIGSGAIAGLIAARGLARWRW